MARPTRRVQVARRRRRRLARVDNDLTDLEWGALRDAWGGCAYCGAGDRPLQRDCVLPISRGGRYTVDNVVPACGACNASKCNTEVVSWLRRKKLDERAFLLRHATIRRALGAPPATDVPVPPDGAAPPDVTVPVDDAVATAVPEPAAPSA
ncbi:HNH endonuclease [Cellulomonas sp. B6]|uniref:HNH endonuclease n=1 Tax=Cellulomonas sp. B6 TaxID=1295626 RepID=UPI0009E6B6CD|nr:HNH endonuclease [Cellulomonas sp. B6]